MMLSRFAVTAMALVALAACSQPQRRGATRGPSTAAPRVGTVVVVSLDGFRHDYHRRTRTPNFDFLARTGAHVGRLIPTFPSQTFPTHATLATGYHPDRHGILNNVFRDRRRGLFKHSNDVGWYETPPLWIHAQRHGLRSHVYHWIGCQGSWRGTEPARWFPFDKTVTDEHKIAAVGKWLDAPRERRLRLAMVYLSGCDRPGHLHGPDSPQVTRCVQRNDRLLGMLISHLRRPRPDWPVTLLVVSDHGMTPTRATINLQLALKQSAPDGVELLVTGPVAHLYTAPRRAAEVRAALSAVCELKQLDCHTMADLPRDLRYHNPHRTGDLVLIARQGTRFDARAPEVFTTARVAGVFGHHGHHPDDPQMAGMLYAWGAGIRSGARLDAARSVDLFPTVCRLLGLPAPGDLDGKVLEPILLKWN